MQSPHSIFVIIVILLFCSLTRGQTTLNITNDIGYAFSHATSGESFILQAGTYNIDSSNSAHINESIQISGEGDVVIACAPAVIAFNVSSASITVKNLQFVNCTNAIFLRGISAIDLALCTFVGSLDTAIVGDGSSFTNITVDNCTFTANSNTTNVAGAIATSNGAILTITNSFFNSNLGKTGGVFYAGNIRNITVRNTQGFNNTAIQGGFAFISTGVAFFEGVTLWNNSAESEGGGVLCTNCNLTSKGSHYNHNTFGAIRSVPPAMLWIDSSTFTGNSCENDGGAISGTQANITNSTFTGNWAGTRGGAVNLTDPSFIDSCQFINNNATSGGALTTGDAKLTNTFFMGNSATSKGGGFFSPNYGSQIIVNTCTFTNNTSNDTGGAVYLVRATVQMISSTFYLNICHNQGAAFYLQNSSLLSNDTSFTGNYANHEGGGVYANFSSLTLTNVSFSTNGASMGGAIYLNGTSANSISSSNFMLNSANQNGGAIYIYESSLDLYNSQCISNTAFLGGALYSSFGSINSSNTTFSGNSARNGGGLYVSSSKLNLDNPTIQINHATGGNGGGIFVTATGEGNPSVVVQGGTISTNGATNGGGVHLNSSTKFPIWLKNVVISGNQVTEMGGGMNLEADVSLNGVTCNGNTAATGGCAAIGDATVQFTNCKIAGNNAAWGGGVYAAGYVAPTNVTITDSMIYSNLATTSGGGCLVSSANMVLSNSSLLQNNCSNYGGAISANNNSQLYVDKAVIGGNTASDGGGVYSENSLVILFSTQVIQNSAQNGGGLYALHTELFSNFSSFTNNTANTGGGLFLDSGLLVNSIIEANYASNASGVYIQENGNVILQSAQLSNANSSSVFCCGGLQAISVLNGSCSFPACDGNCQESTGCQCPFSYTTDPSLDVTVPHIPPYNTTCTPTDPNPCAVRNGGCDPHVACSAQVNGSSICGPCPSGFYTVNGSTCIRYCGNGICDVAQGEDCVSCRRDCNISSCGKCGDGVCDSGESCVSCYEDCLLLCPIKQCDGCSSNGKCVNGICVCEGSWVGPECTESAVPISVSTNSSQPIVDIIVPHVQFSVGIRKLLEKDSQNGTVSEIDLDSLAHEFLYAQSNFSESSQNTVWKYSTVLSNTAIINVTFISFEDSLTPYTFGSSTTEFPAHTLKFSLRVANWPFRNSQNTLLAVMETQATSTSSLGCTTHVDAQKDSGDSIAWVKVTLNGYSAYGQFESYSIIDEIPRKIRFELNDDNTISAVLPHFWDFAEFDPSYAVLVGDGFSGKVDECGNPIKSSHSVKKSVAIAVPVAVIGVALIVAGVLLFLKKRREARTRRQLSNIHMHQRIDSDSKLLHETAKEGKTM